MIVASESRPAFLFRKDTFVESELRAALGAHLLDVRVFELCDVGLRTACAIVRAAGVAPSVLLVERPQEEDAASTLLAALRALPELALLPVVVLGDEDDPEAGARAHGEGADGFLRRPRDVGDTARLGQEVADFVAHHG